MNLFGLPGYFPFGMFLKFWKKIATTSILIALIFMWRQDQDQIQKKLFSRKNVTYIAPQTGPRAASKKDSLVHIFGPDKTDKCFEFRKILHLLP